MDDGRSVNTVSITETGFPSIEATTNTEATITDGTVLAEDLLARCRSLLNELEDFRSFAAEQKLAQDPAIEIRKFQLSVSAELKSLQKVSRASSSCPSNPIIYSLAARRIGPHSRKDHPHPPILQPTILFRHMGSCQGQRKPGDIP